MSMSSHVKVYTILSSDDGKIYKGIKIDNTIIYSGNLFVDYITAIEFCNNHNVLGIGSSSIDEFVSESNEYGWASIGEDSFIVPIEYAGEINAHDLYKLYLEVKEL